MLKQASNFKQVMMIWYLSKTSLYSHRDKRLFIPSSTGEMCAEKVNVSWWILYSSYDSAQSWPITALEIKLFKVCSTCDVWNALVKSLQDMLNLWMTKKKTHR